jgi:MFS family permease
LAFTINFATCVHMIGCWIRFSGSWFHTEWAFWVIFVGQFMGATVNAFITCCTTQVSSNWFGEKERTIATTISAFTNMFGTALVFGLSIMVSASPNASAMPWYFLLQAIFATLICIGSLIFIRSHPPTPASYSQAKVNTTSSLKEDVFVLLGDMNFIIVGLGYAFVVGSINTFLSLINQIVTPKGYSAIEAALFGIFIIMFGMVGCIFFGIVAARTKKILGVIWTCGSCAVASFCIVVIVLHWQRTITNLVICLIATALIGIFGPIVVPLFLELGAETSFPIESSSSNILLITFLNASSIVIILTSDFLRTKDRRGNIISMNNSMYFTLGCLLFGFIVLAFYGGKYKRMEHDNATVEAINQ